LLIVHHRSWPEIDLELVEEKHTRLRQNGISLYCAHSALDAAPGISNGDGIAEATGVRVRERFLPYHGGMAGVIGTTAGTFQEFVDRLRSALGTLVEAHQNTDRFGVVAIASGGAHPTRPMSRRRRPAAPIHTSPARSRCTPACTRRNGRSISSPARTTRPRLSECARWPSSSRLASASRGPSSLSRRTSTD